MSKQNAYEIPGIYAEVILDLVEWCKKTKTYSQHNPENNVLEKIESICIKSRVNDLNHNVLIFNKTEIGVLDDCLYYYRVNRQGNSELDFSEALINNESLYKELNHCLEPITGIKRSIWEDEN